MKALSFIRNKKVIIPVALVVLATFAIVTLAAVKANEQKVAVVKKSESNAVKVEKSEPKLEKTAEVEEINATEVRPEAAQPVVAAEPTPAPIIKSTQEYGNMYLDLTSSPLYQECFNKIVARWPARFTENVREANVKALGVFGSTCSTGILQENGAIIASYGQNGEFFDSPLAASKH